MREEYLHLNRLKRVSRFINNNQVATANKAKNSWLVGKVKCGVCGYALVIRKSDIRKKTLSGILFKVTMV